MRQPKAVGPPGVDSRDVCYFHRRQRSSVSHCLLGSPSLGLEISLMVDASNGPKGAVLQQCSSSPASWQPLVFFSSNKLEPLKHAIQLLILSWTCYSGIRQFHHLLEGRRLIKRRSLMPYTGLWIRGPLANADC